LVTQIDRTKEHREENFQSAHEIARQLKEKGFSAEQIRQMGFDEADLDKKELHIESILAGDQMHTGLAEILEDHIWIIFKNETIVPFYTSDNPIVKRGHVNLGFGPEIGYGSPGIEIAFPLDPDFILLLCEREHFNMYEHLDMKLSVIKLDENVKYYNSLQIISSYRQVFSSNDKFNLIMEVLAKSPSSFDLNRQRIEDI
jgi:hypothetical protein